MPHKTAKNLDPFLKHYVIDKEIKLSQKIITLNLTNNISSTKFKNGKAIFLSTYPSHFYRLFFQNPVQERNKIILIFKFPISIDGTHSNC